ncbi:hypothetical protein IWX84_002420 [Flavobacterium sp. CG_9.10]|nr:hypothetical protein [Flavobacterium sp. CG_9.10]
MKADSCKNKLMDLKFYLEKCNFKNGIKNSLCIRYNKLNYQEIVEEKKSKV